MRIGGRRILVDVERGRTVRDWKPTRLGRARNAAISRRGHRAAAAVDHRVVDSAAVHVVAPSAVHSSATPAGVVAGVARVMATAMATATLTPDCPTARRGHQAYTTTVRPSGHGTR